MIRINEHYRKLTASYLFADIARRVAAYSEANPHIRVLRLGIGDVTQPLPPAVVAAFHEGVEEMARAETFRGYGPEQGYAFLREAIAREDFLARGAQVEADEIFISDGAKCDTGNIQELFAQDIRVAVPDPVYPVYVDTNVMAGRTGAFDQGRYEGLVYLEGTKANGFVPDLPATPVDLVYLCYPNNPTGATITRAALARWVDWAREHKALILYDAAYEAFIRDPEIPHSIFEIPGARNVAIEFRSLSKTAGFTGTRLGYTVIPKDCVAYSAGGTPQSVHALWHRRHTTKFNGVSYPVQKAAAAVFTPEGRLQCQTLIDGYLANAARIRACFQELGYFCVGGDNSPYVWVECGMDSWAFFDMLLTQAGVVCTPGVGFGACGEGYVRFSAFGSPESVGEAMERLRRIVPPRS